RLRRIFGSSSTMSSRATVHLRHSLWWGRGREGTVGKVKSGSCRKGRPQDSLYHAAQVQAAWPARSRPATVAGSAAACLSWAGTRETPGAAATSSCVKDVSIVLAVAMVLNDDNLRGTAEGLTVARVGWLPTRWRFVVRVEDSRDAVTLGDAQAVLR